MPSHSQLRIRVSSEEPKQMFAEPLRSYLRENPDRLGTPFSMKLPIDEEMHLCTITGEEISRVFVGVLDGPGRAIDLLKMEETLRVFPFAFHATKDPVSNLEMLRAIHIGIPIVLESFISRSFVYEDRLKRKMWVVTKECIRGDEFYTAEPPPNRKNMSIIDRLIEMALGPDNIAQFPPKRQ